MTEHEYLSKLEELDRLLNDPATPIHAARVWEILAECSSHPASKPDGNGAAPGRAGA